MTENPMNAQDQSLALQIARQGGGFFCTSEGQQGYVPGKNQNELLNDVIDLLVEIRALLRDLKPAT